MYEILQPPLPWMSAQIYNTQTQMWIPTDDPTNSQYQAYLAWVAAGNTAQPYSPS
jgi:hypothetical protein